MIFLRENVLQLNTVIVISFIFIDAYKNSRRFYVHWCNVELYRCNLTFYRFPITIKLRHCTAAYFFLMKIKENIGKNCFIESNRNQYFVLPLMSAYLNIGVSTAYIASLQNVFAGVCSKIYRYGKMFYLPFTLLVYLLIFVCGDTRCSWKVGNTTGCKIPKLLGK